MGLMTLTGLDKIVKLFRTVRTLGGVIPTIRQRYIMDDTKVGTFIGQDKFGNKYYENTEYFVPRDRWVEYPRYKWLEYDATQIPVEWYRWLHHTTDEPPTKVPLRREKYSLDHVENLSLEPESRFVPYSTTREKIQSWMPEQKK